MKKLTLIATVSALAMSASSYAGEDMACEYYLRVDGGAAWIGNVKDIKPRDLKFRTSGTAGLGVGYYLGTKVRTELDYTHFFAAKTKKVDSAVQDILSLRNNIDAVFAKVYYDVFSCDLASFFVGGGIGVASNNLKVRHILNASDITSKKSNTRFAYTLAAGSSFQVAEGVTADIQYSWSDLGRAKARSSRVVDEATVVNDVVSKVRTRAHGVSLGLRFAI